jgi:hypothetical protein
VDSTDAHPRRISIHWIFTLVCSHSFPFFCGQVTPDSSLTAQYLSTDLICKVMVVNERLQATPSIAIPELARKSGRTHDLGVVEPGTITSSITNEQFDTGDVL